MVFGERFSGVKRVVGDLSGKIQQLVVIIVMKIVP